MKPKYTSWVLFISEKKAKDFCNKLTAQGRGWSRSYKPDQAPDAWEVRWNEVPHE